MHDEKMDILFAHEDAGSFLGEPADPRTAAGEAAPTPEREEEYLASLTANAGDLAQQRWAVVVPEGPVGERLRHLVEPLAARRAQEQGAEVLTVRVPPGMSAEAAMRWRKDVYPGIYEHREYRRPRYLLILGDMDQVSMDTQQVLALDGLPGRLSGSSDDAYLAYVDKVLAWERAPSPHSRPRSLFYTVHDGSGATVSGYDKLVRPCFAHCEEVWRTERSHFPAAAVLDAGSRHEPDPGELLGLAAASDPTVLFSLSHGLGPPRRRPWTPPQARARQGAMHFGSAGALMPADIGTGPFLPGGLWLYFACFGAGTPSQSAYHHWLAMLEQRGMKGLGPLRAVLDGLDREGGFTSGMARAALANPDGPLAVIGHVDLAWSYSYEELRAGEDGRVRGSNRAEGFFDLLARMVKGERVGVTVLDLQRNLTTVSTELNQRYDRCKREGHEPEGASPGDQLTLGNLWMQRQDLLGYVILGDPAARLPLAPETASGRGSLSWLGGQGGAERGEDLGEDIVTDISDDRLDEVEEAILALAVGERSTGAVARALALGRGDVRALEDAYRESGRRALARRLQVLHDASMTDTEDDV